jgi:hypothetical protein
MFLRTVITHLPDYAVPLPRILYYEPETQSLDIFISFYSCITYQYIKFQNCSYVALLVVAVNERAKCKLRFRVVATLLLAFPTKEILTKVAQFPDIYQQDISDRTLYC